MADPIAPKPTPRVRRVAPPLGVDVDKAFTLPRAGVTIRREGDEITLVAQNRTTPGTIAITVAIEDVDGLVYALREISR
jgi:hypothetical protein